jgi:hypothetical protein
MVSVLVGFIVLSGRLVDAAHAIDRHVLDEVFDDEVGLFGGGVFKIGVDVFHDFSPVWRNSGGSEGVRMRIMALSAKKLEVD